MKKYVVDVYEQVVAHHQVTLSAEDDISEDFISVLLRQYNNISELDKLQGGSITVLAVTNNAQSNTLTVGSINKNE